MPTIFLAGTLLAVFFALDWALYRREPEGARTPSDTARLSLEGVPNFLLLAGVIAAVLLSGVWKPGIAFDIAGARVELQDALRSLALILLGGVSLVITPAAVREHNRFHWAPIIEVAKLFAAIFVTIFPVLAILEAGREGALRGIFELVGDGSGNPDNAMVFWMTGLLSAFLDNAPTYLVFFNLMGGDAQKLMGEHAQSLAALSMGAVYFGALTYIGNAPNFMIKAIAEDRGVVMPSFFAFFAWAALVMVPLLAVVAAILAVKVGSESTFWRTFHALRRAKKVVSDPTFTRARGRARGTGHARRARWSARCRPCATDRKSCSPRAAGGHARGGSARTPPPSPTRSDPREGRRCACPAAAWSPSACRPLPARPACRSRRWRRTRR